MKSLRTIRQDPKPAEPVREAALTHRAAGASAAGAASSGDARRESRTSLPGPSAGWRLPSGQLLVEYALQTCFTGSPFERSPFQADPADPNSGSGKVSEGIQRLHAAVSRETAASRETAGKTPEPEQTPRHSAKAPSKGRSRG